MANIVALSSLFTFSHRPSPPITISTDPKHLHALQLRRLLAASAYSCHRFPALDAAGRPDPVDLDKLRIALAHSFVVVSVFCSPKFLPDGAEDCAPFVFDDLSEREEERRLVGFGRAVSDRGLTASIHDVVVM